MRKRLSIAGMSCMHCVMHVKDALKDVKGVIDAQASLDDSQAVVDMNGEVGDDRLKQAILDAGYEVVKIESL